MKKSLLVVAFFAASIMVMLALQNAANAAGAPAAAANPTEETKPVQILITNVNVWDGTSDDVHTGMNVLIEGNKIKTVAKKISATDAEVIDGKGGTLSPGMIDMHQHLNLNGGLTIGTTDKDAYVQGAHASRAAQYLLMLGFTTLRDIAGNTTGLKKEIMAGRLPGPRIYTSGAAIGPTGGHSDWGVGNDSRFTQDYQEIVGNTIVADGRAEILKAARWNFRQGADYLKIMGGGGVSSVFDPLEMIQYSLEEMKAAVQVANEYRSYVAIHAYHDDSYNLAMDAGIKSLEHGFLITEPTVKRMAAEGVWWSWQPFGSYTTFAGEFPDWFSADMKKKGAMVFEGSVRVAKWMKKHGVKTVLGSDMFGWDNWFSALTNVTVPVDIPDSGYTSLDCMKMATSNAGLALRELTGPAMNPFKEAKLGVIEEKAWADILIWKGNPTKDIKLILQENNLMFIMKDGKIYKNLTVPSSDDFYRGPLRPSGHSFETPPPDGHSWEM